jgi:hypothetical protein
MRINMGVLYDRPLGEDASWRGATLTYSIWFDSKNGCDLSVGEVFPDR